MQRSMLFEITTVAEEKPNFIYKSCLYLHVDVVGKIKRLVLPDTAIVTESPQVPLRSQKGDLKTWCDFPLARTACPKRLGRAQYDGCSPAFVPEGQE